MNAFGNEKFAKRECELTELHLQGRGGEDVKMSGLSFEAICSPLPAGVCLDEHSHLLGLDLADYVSESDGSESNIDVLIGSDYYWDVVSLVGLCLVLSGLQVTAPTTSHQILWLRGRVTLTIAKP